jgi:hypothetical protein
VRLAILAMLAPMLTYEPVVPLREAAIGGYGGPQFRFTRIAGEWNTLGGGSLDVLLRRDVFLGLTYVTPDPKVTTSITYAGARLGTLLFLGGRVHLSLATTFGGGSFAGRGVFVVTPEALFTFDLGRTTRIAVGVDYRIADGAVGPSFVVQLQGGVFDPKRAPRREIAATNALAAKLTTAFGRAIFLYGGGTRLLFHRTFSVGVAGYSTLGRVERAGDDERLAFGYGGLWTEWTPAHDALFHLGISTLLGGGSLQSNGFLATEVDVSAILNVTEFLQIALGVGGRLAIPFTTKAISISDASGPAAGLQLRFGGW